MLKVIADNSESRKRLKNGIYILISVLVVSYVTDSRGIIFKKYDGLTDVKKIYLLWLEKLNHTMVLKISEL